MFQFPSCASYGYFTHPKITGHDSCWVSPFGHLRINAWLAASRSLSWPSPSFFAGMSQGIHLVPWVAYHLQKLIKSVTTLRDFFDSSPILWKPKKFTSFDTNETVRFVLALSLLLLLAIIYSAWFSLLVFSAEKSVLHIINSSLDLLFTSTCRFFTWCLLLLTNLKHS